MLRTDRPEPSTRPSTRFFRPELDVLRFFAFLLVFLTHAIPSTVPPLLYAIREGACFGVAVFFVLSAFLITELLSRERDETGHIHLRAFYMRRVLRIWPLYFAALFVCFALSHVLHGEPAVRPTQLLPYLLLLGNWPAATSYTLLPLGFYVLWSIGVEEQFYMIWPAVVRWGRKALLIVLGFIWIASQIFILWTCRRGPAYYVIYFSTFTQMQYFAVGAAISLLLKGRIPRFSTPTRVAMVFAGVALFCVFYRRVDVGSYVPYLSASVGSALIFFGFYGASIPKRAAFMGYLGKISYGLYVLHAFMILVVGRMVGTRLHHGTVLTNATIGLSLTILAAHLSYQFLEKPFLRLKERFEVVKSRTASGSIQTENNGLAEITA